MPVESVLPGRDPILRRAPSPAVALETAVISCGLPSPQRQRAAAAISSAVRAEGAAPAFVGVISGRAIVGLEPEELALLAEQGRKLSTRDLPAALARRASGGTTVAATVFLAHRAGVPVAATGGIGGVHPGTAAQDVSADLLELARTPIILVCAGAKAITDVPATLERLESLSVTVVGFGTDEFPAFWSAESGLRLDLRADSAEEIAAIWRAARALGQPGALLVCVPPPANEALSGEESEAAVSQALADLRTEGIRGAEVTPFLLARVAELTEGRSLRANLALLENNARVAASIARAVEGRE